MEFPPAPDPVGSPVIRDDEGRHEVKCVKCKGVLWKRKQITEGIIAVD
jgi:hypothetical protein